MGCKDGLGSQNRWFPNKKSSDLIGYPSKQATVSTNISTSLPVTWGGGHANNNSLPDAMVRMFFEKRQTFCTVSGH